MGFGVARLDGKGDARASERETGNKSDSHAFSLYMRVMNILLTQKYYKDEKEQLIYHDGSRGLCLRYDKLRIKKDRSGFRCRVEN